MIELREHSKGWLRPVGPGALAFRAYAGMNGGDFPASRADLIELAKVFDGEKALDRMIEKKVEARLKVTRWQAPNRGMMPAPDELQGIVGGSRPAADFETAIALRDYQRRAAAVLLASGSLLLADDCGLGKTASAIAALTAKECRPALVVTLAHLPGQWIEETARFAPALRVVRLAGKPGATLPPADVWIISYAKLAQWADLLAGEARLVVWDEVQELRGEKSARSRAAVRIAAGAKYRLGLSATPIYNFADEFRTIFEVIRPGFFGTKADFAKRYCQIENGSMMFRDAPEFGERLRKTCFFMRRTRADVARELPQINAVEYGIDSDAELYESMSAEAAPLAEIILSGTDQKLRWRAAERMPNILRMATGYAKAKFVAKFVEMLLESRKNVVLFGWHRCVIEEWKKALAAYEPRLYTGSESAKQKAQSRADFISGKSRVLILSLRSGVGLDGLQHASDAVVFGELDFCDAVHQQAVRRLARDGQRMSVDVFFLVATVGADPSILRGLSMKSICSGGLLSPNQPQTMPAKDKSRIEALAMEFLASRANKETAT